MIYIRCVFIKTYIIMCIFFHNYKITAAIKQNTYVNYWEEKSYRYEIEETCIDCNNKIYREINSENKEKFIELRKFVYDNIMRIDNNGYFILKNKT